MFKKRKFYTLLDISKQLVFTPLLFVFLSAIISVLVIAFILEFKKTNEISLFIKEDEYSKKTILSQYVNDIKFNASSTFDKEENSLKNAVISLLGYMKYSKDSTLVNLEYLMYELEQSSNLNFVIFKKSSGEILYGKEIIEYLQVITDSKVELNKFRTHMIRNIEYIGDDNLIYWMDKEKRKIRLSYFKNIESKDVYIGAFSKIDDMRDSTREVILHSIFQKSKYYNDRYFWFYDYDLGYVYNYYNKGQKLDAKYILEQDRLNSSNEILKKYKENTFTSSNDIYNFTKYNFLVSIKSDFLPHKIAHLKYEYNANLTTAILLVILITIVLVIASVLFSRFINTIFHRYNKRLETRNSMYKKWKDRYELAIIASNDGLWDIDLKTNHIYFSKKWLDMFGYKDGDINTLDEWLHLIHKEDKHNVKQK